MRAIRLFAATAIAAGLLVFAQAGPVFACSCAMSGVADQVDNADRVLSGTLVDITEPPSGAVISSADPIRYTVAVDEAYKGPPTARLDFTSARFGASCGLEGMRVDRRYMFFLVSEGGELTANLCGGTTPTSGVVESNVADVTGPPTAAEVAAEPDPQPQYGSQTPPERIDDDAAQSATRSWIVAAGAAGLVLVGVAGGYLWRRRRPGPSGA